MHRTLREPRTIDAVLREAQSRLDRLSPADAWAAARTGDALIIDIRTPTDRMRDGVIPGSLHLPRTVLEWRVDPMSPSAHPSVGGHDRHLVIVCNEGFSSSLAAVALHELGFWRATDVVDGIRGWESAGLPLVAPASLVDGVRDGDGPPEPL
jgi:rhodanese-related sulfurtransferase